MRRSLVLSDEAARHPFLRALPPHVRQQIAPVQQHRYAGLTMSDLREFLMAYCACFLAVSTFIA